MSRPRLPLVRTLASLTSLAAIATASLLTACAVEPDDGPAPTDQPGDGAESTSENRTFLPVVFDGVRYQADDFVALGVSPAHFASTADSVRDGYVYAFATAADRDQFAATQAVSRAGDDGTRALFKRQESRFYDLTSFSDKVLELDPGEAVLDLSANGCGCNQDISSIKASEVALFTRVYDGVNFTGDSWSIPSGSEISNLAQYIRSNGQSWDQDISAIQLTQ